MEFIDSTGHIFSLPSYENIPTGYEYDNNKYIFWIDEEYNNRLSVNNYYIKCIRVLIDMTDVSYDNFNISIKSDSNIFKFIPSNIIQYRTNNFNGLEINESEFVSELIYNSNDIINSSLTLIENIEDYNYISISYDTIQSLNKSIDIYEYNNDVHDYTITNNIIDTGAYYIRAVEPNKYCIIPFYVVGNSTSEGSWTSNILVHVKIDAQSQAVYNIEKSETKEIEIDESVPLFVQSLKDGSSIKLRYVGQQFTRNIYISSNNLTWTLWDKSIKVLNEGDILYFKCDTGGEGFNIDADNRYLNFEMTGKFNVGGNIMSLMHNDFIINNTIRPVDNESIYCNQKAFQWLFSECTSLVSAASLILPATVLTARCYFHMFNGCTNLVNPPLLLPSNTLVNDCYNSMFAKCTSLVTTPLIECNILSLDTSCMANMFGGCTSLKTILLKVDNIVNTDNAEYNIRNWTNNVKDHGTLIVNNSCSWIDNSYLRNILLPNTWEYSTVSTLNENTVMQNITAQIKYTTVVTYTKDISIEDYCPITVGGLFVDECEELIINGKNMGVNLPKDIIKAMYQSNYFDSYIDESLYNEKVKEYLFNYMQIKGECGNFNSAINSLNWFGWGDKISISRLLRNDNQFINQYLIDNFDIYNDVPESSKFFKNTPNISLQVKAYEESGEYYTQDYTKYFYGEGHPILKDLFKEVIEVKHDNITFYKSFFDYTFTELSLKLACLRYYYKKYFLPIHLKIHSASINQKVYTNDIKFICEATANITEDPYLVKDDNVYVNINADYNVYFYNSEHYVDDNFNEFSYYEYVGKNYEDNLYYINDTCLEIPITFGTRVYKHKLTGNIKSIEEYKLLNNKNEYETTIIKDGFYNTHIIIENSNGNTCFESHFSFTQKDNGEIIVIKNYNEEQIEEETKIVPITKSINTDIKYNSLIIYPKFLMTTDKYDLTTWIDKEFTIHVCCNNTWFRKKIKPSFANTYIEMGKLTYNYSDSFKQLSELNPISKTVKFNSHINNPQFIIMDDINYINDLDSNNDLNNMLSKYINEINISSLHKFYNKIIVYNIFKEGEQMRYNTNDNLYDIYSVFFGVKNNIISQKITLNSGIVDYDLYLMHEDPDEVETAYWYIVFISKDRMLLNDEYYNVFDRSITIKHTRSDRPLDDPEFYTIKYLKSSRKFLINRCDFETTNGINHFDKNDIILARLNNDKLAFNYDMTSKWEVSPYSLGMDNTGTVYANNNICIVSIAPNKFNYVKGVYNIKVNYCVDSYQSHSFTKKCIFKVD